MSLAGTIDKPVFAGFRGPCPPFRVCPECGTQLYATSADDQKVFGIRVGTCNQRAQLVPQRQVWCRSALPWVHIDTPQKAQQQA